MEQRAIQGDAAKENFPNKGNAEKIAQMMTSEPISWEEFKRGILA